MTIRIETLRKKVEELGYDAYLVADGMERHYTCDIIYLTGIPAPHAVLLLVNPNGDHVLYTSVHGLKTAKQKVENECQIKAADVDQSSLELLLEDLPGMDLERIGFATLSAEAYLKLAAKAKNARFIPDRDTMWKLRMIKSKEEISNIRKAAKIANEGQKTAAEVIKPGMREYEVAAEVEHTMRVLGSEDEGHRTVLTSGPRTTLSSESGYTSDRMIKEGELVVVDTGATINGYRTDLGRPYVAGRPTSKQKEIYKLVRSAWNAAFACVKPGAIGGNVDAAARKVFGEYEKHFTHAVGHGIGLTFEPPALEKNSKDVLKENMTVTVEPGLYIDGFGGILVEDTTLVLKDGVEHLTAPPLDWD